MTSFLPWVRSLKAIVYALLATELPIPNVVLTRRFSHLVMLSLQLLQNISKVTLSCTKIEEDAMNPAYLCFCRKYLCDRKAFGKTLSALQTVQVIWFFVFSASASLVRKNVKAPDT